MRTMYKACMDMDNVLTTFWKFFKEKIGVSTKNENRTITWIAEYLKKLDFPYYPDEILSKNAKASSMIENKWIESIAKIKSLTGLDLIIGFKNTPDHRKLFHNFLYLGLPRKDSLL